jgi:hypothetical protein
MKKDLKCAGILIVKKAKSKNNARMLSSLNPAFKTITI